MPSPKLIVDPGSSERGMIRVSRNGTKRIEKDAKKSRSSKRENQKETYRIDNDLLSHLANENLSPDENSMRIRLPISNDLLVNQKPSEKYPQHTKDVRSDLLQNENSTYRLQTENSLPNENRNRMWPLSNQTRLATNDRPSSRHGTILCNKNPADRLSNENLANRPSTGTPPIDLHDGSSPDSHIDDFIANIESYAGCHSEWSNDGNHNPMPNGNHNPTGSSCTGGTKDLLHPTGGTRDLRPKDSRRRVGRTGNVATKELHPNSINRVFNPTMGTKDSFKVVRRSHLLTTDRTDCKSDLQNTSRTDLQTTNLTTSNVVPGPPVACHQSPTHKPVERPQMTNNQNHAIQIHKPNSVGRGGAVNVVGRGGVVNVVGSGGASNGDSVKNLTKIRTPVPTSDADSVDGLTGVRAPQNDQLTPAIHENDQLKPATHENDQLNATKKENDRLQRENDQLRDAMKLLTEKAVRRNQQLKEANANLTNVKKIYEEEINERDGLIKAQSDQLKEANANSTNLKDMCRRKDAFIKAYEDDLREKNEKIELQKTDILMLREQQNAEILMLREQLSERDQRMQRHIHSLVFPMNSSQEATPAAIDSKGMLSKRFPSTNEFLMGEITVEEFVRSKLGDSQGSSGLKNENNVMTGRLSAAKDVATSGNRVKEGHHVPADGNFGNAAATGAVANRHLNNVEKNSTSIENTTIRVDNTVNINLSDTALVEKETRVKNSVGSVSIDDKLETGEISIEDIRDVILEIAGNVVSSSTDGVKTNVAVDNDVKSPSNGESAKDSVKDAVSGDATENLRQVAVTGDADENLLHFANLFLESACGNDIANLLSDKDVTRLDPNQRKRSSDSKNHNSDTNKRNSDAMKRSSDRRSRSARRSESCVCGSRSQQSSQNESIDIDYELIKEGILVPELNIGMSGSTDLKAADSKSDAGKGSIYSNLNAGKGPINPNTGSINSNIGSINSNIGSINSKLERESIKSGSYVKFNASSGWRLSTKGDEKQAFATPDEKNGEGASPHVPQVKNTFKGKISYGLTQWNLTQIGLTQFDQRESFADLAGSSKAEKASGATKSEHPTVTKSKNLDFKTEATNSTITNKTGNIEKQEKTIPKKSDSVVEYKTTKKSEVLSKNKAESIVMKKAEHSLTARHTEPSTTLKKTDDMRLEQSEKIIGKATEKARVKTTENATKKKADRRPANPFNPIEGGPSVEERETLEREKAKQLALEREKANRKVLEKGKINLKLRRAAMDKAATENPSEHGKKTSDEHGKSIAGAIPEMITNQSPLVINAPTWRERVYRPMMGKALDAPEGLRIIESFPDDSFEMDDMLPRRIRKDTFHMLPDDGKDDLTRIIEETALGMRTDMRSSSVDSKRPDAPQPFDAQRPSTNPEAPQRTLTVIPMRQNNNPDAPQRILTVIPMRQNNSHQAFPQTTGANSKVRTVQASSSSARASSSSAQAVAQISEISEVSSSGGVKPLYLEQTRTRSSKAGGTTGGAQGGKTTSMIMHDIHTSTDQGPPKKKLRRNESNVSVNRKSGRSTSRRRNNKKCDAPVKQLKKRGEPAAAILLIDQIGGVPSVIDVTSPSSNLKPLEQKRSPQDKLESCEKDKLDFFPSGQWGPESMKAHMSYEDGGCDKTDSDNVDDDFDNAGLTEVNGEQAGGNGQLLTPVRTPAVPDQFAAPGHSPVPSPQVKKCAAPDLLNESRCETQLSVISNVWERLAKAKDRPDLIAKKERDFKREKRKRENSANWPIAYTPPAFWRTTLGNTPQSVVNKRKQKELEEGKKKRIEEDRMKAVLKAEKQKEERNIARKKRKMLEEEKKMEEEKRLEDEAQNEKKIADKKIPENKVSFDGKFFGIKDDEL